MSSPFDADYKPQKFQCGLADLEMHGIGTLRGALRRGWEREVEVKLVFPGIARVLCGSKPALAIVFSNSGVEIGLGHRRRLLSCHGVLVRRGRYRSVADGLKALCEIGGDGALAPQVSLAVGARCSKKTRRVKQS